MKKFLTIVLAAALVCALTAPAMSAALETSGELRVRGWYLDNYLANGKSTEFWDQRLRLNMVWPVAENVKIQARADILEGFWGGDGNIANHTANQNPITGEISVKETPAQPYEARQQIIFDQVNMQFAWPGSPLTFTLGRQDVSWGTGYYAKADNRDRFKVSAKFDPVTIGFAYDKMKEVFAGHHADLDDYRGWTLSAVANAAGWQIGVLGTYVMDETRTSTPLGDLKYIGGDIFATGKAGPVDLKFEGAYLTGQSGKKQLNGDDEDLTGMGAYFGAFMPAGPVTIGLEGAFAAGDDPDTKDENEGGFKSDYNGPYWSVIFYQNMDYPGYAMDGQTSDLAGDFQVKNALSGKLSVVYPTPLKGLTFVVNGLYATANQVASGDKPMGFEGDLVAIYGITENVSLTAGVGYAVLGDYWKGKNGAKAGDTPDNPIGTVVAFTTKF